MATHKKFDAVVTNGEYKDRNGETKKRYLTVGSVFEDDKGRLSLKLDAVPTVNWSGWISFYEPKARDGAPMAGSTANHGYAGAAGGDDQIPF